MQHGRGFLPDDPDPNAWTTEKLYGARRAHATPLAATIETFVDHPRNQLHTSSCVGWALAMAIFLRLRVMGFDPVFPSAAGLYKNARALARLSPTTPLTDDGCQPGKAIRGARTLGIPDENEVPFDPDTINADLDLAQLELAREFLLTGYYAIPGSDRNASEEVCWALAQGFPVIGGTQADNTFDVYEGQTVLSAPDPRVMNEGHMILILGYKTVNGKRLYRGLNSWGPDPKYPDEPFNRWGDKGFFWADEAFVQTLVSRYVITVEKSS